jgi:hypothetical protein
MEQQVLRASLAPQRSVVRGEAMSGVIGMAGGTLVIVGSWLPWFTLYAGLHPLRGITGLNGQLLAAGGLLAAVVSVMLLTKPRRSLHWLLGSLSLCLTLFTAWILAGVPATYRAMQENPLLVAQLGPGLWVVLGGTLLIAAGASIKTKRDA